MAFNWQTFKTRSLTAAIFVVVMLAGLLINRWTFFILFSVIHFGCWWEYLKLVEEIRQTRFHPYLKFGVTLLGYGLMISFCTAAFQIDGYRIKDLSLPVSAVGFAVAVIGIFQKSRIEPRSVIASMCGLIYISLSWGLLIDLFGYSGLSFTDNKTTDISFHDSTYVVPSYFYPAAVIAALWINDTMAYIIGSLIGKTQMSKISPKKTWEGTIAGIVLSGVVIFLVSYYLLHFKIISYGLMILAIIASITGTAGDLFESKLKRMAGVKDSGRIMPGHGGFLDRFDSLLVATPFVWLYVYFFMR